MIGRITFPGNPLTLTVHNINQRKKRITDSVEPGEPFDIVIGIFSVNDNGDLVGFTKPLSRRELIDRLRFDCILEDEYIIHVSNGRCMIEDINV